MSSVSLVVSICILNVTQFQSVQVKLKINTSTITKCLGCAKCPIPVQTSHHRTKCPFCKCPINEVVIEQDITFVVFISELKKSSVNLQSCSPDLSLYVTKHPKQVTNI